jgi:hypothetical protein
MSIIVPAVRPEVEVALLSPAISACDESGNTDLAPGVEPDAMRTWSLLALTVAAATAVATSSGGHPAPGGSAAGAPGPLLGVQEQAGALRLAHVDPETLRLEPAPRVAVGSPACAPRSGGEMCSSIPAWDRSPGRSRLAVARNRPHAAHSLRLVDPRQMRVEADVPVAGGPLGLVAWLAGGRVLALQEVCCQERQQVLTIDAAHRRVIGRQSVEGTVLRVARTPRALVMLVAPTSAIGAPLLEVARGDGTVTVVTLDRVRAGVEVTDPAAHRVKRALPGLAVDRAGRRAFVVAPGLVAEVDLRDLAVGYHALGHRTSLLDRVRDWIDPVAEAKEDTGPVRTAIWLETGVLAVTGAGLSLVDTRSWNARTLDRDSSDVRLVGDLLLAAGERGLTAYGLDGGKRFRLFEGQAVWVSEVYDGRAYVGSPGANPLRVVDPATGRVLGERVESIPRLLDAPASWWE